MYTKLKLCPISGKIWAIFISFSISAFSEIEFSVHVLGSCILISQDMPRWFSMLYGATATFLLQDRAMLSSKPEKPLKTGACISGDASSTQRACSRLPMSPLFFLNVKFPYVPTLQPKERRGCVSQPLAFAALYWNIPWCSPQKDQ